MGALNYEPDFFDDDVVSGSQYMSCSDHSYQTFHPVTAVKCMAGDYVEI